MITESSVPPEPDPALIRLGPAHLVAAQALSAAEGWPHRLEDWAFLMSMSTGFGSLAGGKLVGTGLLTPYGLGAATCNMIIVAPAMRGRGLGRRLMNALLDEAGGRDCRLTATEDGRPLYERLGFVGTGRISQWQGLANALPAPAGVTPATPTDLADMAQLDWCATGMDRSDLLARLIAAGPAWTLRDADGLHGFVACRPFGRGHLLGPLAARDDAAAEALIRAAIAAHAGRFLRVDLTEAGARHQALVRSAGLMPVGGGLAMTRPGMIAAPCATGASTYALASQALC